MSEGAANERQRPRRLLVLTWEESEGEQIHVEDLASCLAGGERCDAGARWAELEPAYEVLSAHAG